MAKKKKVSNKSRKNTGKRSSKISKPSLKGRSAGASLIVGNRVPKAFMRFAPGPNSDTLRVVGLEPIAELQVSDATVEYLNTPLSAADDSIFPRLSSIAAIFEEYRFARLRLHYYPLCPATTQGQVSMLVNHDPLESVAGNAFAIAQYEDSCVGTVAAKLSTDWWLPRDDQHYKTDPSNASAPDLAMRSPGIVYIQTSGGAAEIQPVAGLVLLEYDVTFTHPQPVKEEGTPLVFRPPDGEITSTSEAVGSIFNSLRHGTILSHAGSATEVGASATGPVGAQYMPQQSDGTAGLFSGSSSSIGGSSADLRDVLAAFRIILGAATVDEKTLEQDPFKGSGSGLNFLFTPKKGWSCENPGKLQTLLGPNSSKAVKEYASRVLDVISCTEDDCKGDSSLSQSWPPLPQVAGDVTIYLRYANASYAAVLQTAQAVYSQGTGALNLQACYNYAVQNDFLSYHLYPATNEERTVSHNGSLVAQIVYDEYAS